MQDSDKKQISVTGAIEKGWSIMLVNLPRILLLLFIAFAILFLFSLILGAYSQLLSYPILGTTLNQIIAKEVLGTLIIIAIATTSLKLTDNKKLDINDLISKQHLFFHVLIADFFYYAAVIIGLILFIVPGIIFALRFSLYDLYIVDEECGPFEALKKSWKTVRGYTWRWLGFVILSYLILFLGLLFLGIGLFLAWPTTVIARALLYRKLKNSGLFQIEVIPTHEEKDGFKVER